VASLAASECAAAFTAHELLAFGGEPAFLRTAWHKRLNQTLEVSTHLQ
jgi:hypothetical protein